MADDKAKHFEHSYKWEPADIAEGVVFGIGNPLLDMLANVNDDFLAKYGMKEDNAILAGEEHQKLYQELARDPNVKYHAGGDTLNVIKYAQWLLGRPNATTYIGCIGDDEFGSIMAKGARNMGVNTPFQVDPTAPTGTCACLITGKYRSLCANLGAAKKYTLDHLEKPENWALLNMAKAIYIGGYFWDTCEAAFKRIAEHTKTSGQLFMVNLSAPFIASIYKQQFLDIMPYVDYVFCNDSEAATFGEAVFKTKDVKEIALKLAAMPSSKPTPRTVIFTQGGNPTIVAQDGKISEFHVLPIDPSDIIDTTGAGDSFCGAFIAELVTGAPLEACIAAGNFASNQVIRHFGAGLPPSTPHYTPFRLKRS